MKYKEGDLVRIVSCNVNPSFVGRNGIVVKALQADVPLYKVMVSGETISDYATEDCLEPLTANSIWHPMSECPIKGEVILVQTKDTFYGVSVQKGGTTYKNRNKDRYVRWAYTSDLLKLDDPCKIGKNKQGEPVSEELGDYINELSKQFPDVSFAKLSRIAVRVSRWQQNQDVKNKQPKVTDRTELDEYAYQCAYDMSNDWAIDNPTWKDVKDAVRLGAKWQKNHLWKPADGEDLPEYEREVIVLTQHYPLEGSEYAVSFAHRPNPDGWDAKSIITEKREHYTPNTYGKGGWNIPDVKYWLDVELPKEKEL